MFSRRLFIFNSIGRHIEFLLWLSSHWIYWRETYRAAFTIGANKISCLIVHGVREAHVFEREHIRNEPERFHGVARVLAAIDR